ncbi:restriction endonuclease subunit S [Micromonospora sp. WMMD1076]|uniref:restriction endonuclease subunit S n=1 Tax=Micromonospora sp. WMMD1076 TaxID=3016103 RepID=UPI00249C79CF|nr:restriction endonuclease subunit S [Micromonospora sp. WMMD1076]WFF06222.1 restriction endonuclease subunit S [Micromonospora sp. WMMD1076]
MTKLPVGWIKTTLGEIANTSLGKMLDRGKSSDENPRPYLRNINVQWGRIDQSDVLFMDISPDQEERFRLRDGDLLVCEGGEVGRCAVWRGGNEYIAFQKALHRVRPLGAIEPLYLRYLLEDLSRRKVLDSWATGSTIKHLPQEQLRQLPILLPPLAEQNRLVAALEDHLSRCDAAKSSVSAAGLRLRRLKKRLLIDSVPLRPVAGWRLCTVAEAGSVDLGRQRHPDWHSGPDMRPYLRVANVFEDRIDLTDVMEMNFPPPVFEKFRLREGDILLNEGQSPELLGRPAMYRGVPTDVAFTNSLLRFRADEGVDPEWALLVFRRHMHAGRFSREVRITTNIAHLSAGRFKAIEFPVPPLAEQRAIVSRTKEVLAGLDRLSDAIRQVERQADNLRASLLAEAFAGRLVPQDPDDEPASELLARIQAERAAVAPKQRARATRTRKELAAPPTRVTGDNYQQEALPL